MSFLILPKAETGGCQASITVGLISLDSLWQILGYTIAVVALVLIVGAFVGRKKARKQKFMSDLLSTAFLANCKYKIALGLVNCGVFDFDPKTRKITKLSSGIDKEVADLIDGSPQKVIYENRVHCDYVPVFEKIFDDFVAGESTVETVVKTNSQKARWVKLTLTSYKDIEENTMGGIGTIEDITQEKENQLKFAEERKNHLAMKQAAENDSLTGLLNRRASENMIGRAVGKTLINGDLGVFFMIDLDCFKKVNDRMGHLRGDILLKETANELQQIFPDDAVIGRMGGDEFCVYIGSIEDRAEATEKASRACGIMQNFFEENEKCKQVSASVGVAFCPSHGASFSELYQNSDIALYDAKSRGKNTFSVFGC